MMMSSHEKIREIGEGSSSSGGGGILIAPSASDNHHRQSSSSGGSGGGAAILIAPPSSDNHHRQSSSSGGGSSGVILIASSPSDNHHQSSSSIVPSSAPQLSRYESQKRRDWNTFGQYLKNQRPPVPLPQCNYSHVLDFLRYLDQFGKTKVHLQGCLFFGQPEPPGPCTCPLRQAWGSLDALIGRLRAAYEENGGLQENNPFASGAIRVYLREVRDAQAKARGIPYKKKKKKRPNLQIKASNNNNNDHDGATSANFRRN